MIETYTWIIWLALFVAMLGVEALGPALVSVWFSFGALIALIVSFIPEVPWWVEVVIFVVISLATLLALRPVLRRYFKRNNYNTNIDSFTGKRGYVIEDITYLKPGAVKIGDVSWTAIPTNRDDKILENEVIEVVAVSGNKLIVKKVEVK
ncbi:MAG: NfeD family protein [Bacilli bacterium]|nr:NfeD family protein [Bacilli bacterium]